METCRAVVAVANCNNKQEQQQKKPNNAGHYSQCVQISNLQREKPRRQRREICAVGSDQKIA